jgi:segregation and condensation protein B
VTRTYIEQIRGVDSSYTVGLLVEKGFLEPCGRLDAPGRPMLFRTTAAFLRVFGLSSLEELPSYGEAPEIAGEDLQALAEGLAEVRD